VKRVCAGLILCCGALALCADTPRPLFQDQPPRLVWRSRPGADGLDTPVGNVWFEVHKTEQGKTWMQPLSKVVFGMREISAPRDNNLPLGLTQCFVTKRAMIAQGAPDFVVFNMTLVKCGLREFAIDDLLLTTGPAAEVQK
jgi:hypothetical protein